MIRQTFSAFLFLFFQVSTVQAQPDNWKREFTHPGDKYKPGVYWYFMDGNMTATSITGDLESMKKAGIGNLVFLEVNVGVPRGDVLFLGEKWDSLFVFAEKEARRLGIEVTLGIGPGWTGSGGPWVKGKESMKHLVASQDTVSADEQGRIVLPVPPPRTPFFGVDDLPADFRKAWQEYYEDIIVLAFPLDTTAKFVSDPDAKALYYRAPYNSGIVAPYLPAPSGNTDSTGSLQKRNIVNLTGKMSPDGTLNWRPVSGRWVVMRFGSRNNGAITRPAPVPGLGFESDKFDSVALDHHLAAYVGRLLTKIGGVDRHLAGGLKRIHLDSWEMGAQNWSQDFRNEFIKRRGYDPVNYFPVYTGRAVGSPSESERFLWDLRQTAMELIIDQHARHVKTYGRKNGLALSIEPYDMNPTADLELGSVADIPMAEFWTKGFGFNSAYSVIEATSIGHVMGKSLVPSEAFTAVDEGWRMYPGSMKNQGDWAFASGINRLVYHTFQNQFLDDSLKPGATMAQFSVHWDRGQTWWPMVNAYHDYVSRCQFLLRQGRAVADVLYLTPEGAPHVFVPPASALRGDTLGDRKGFNFDGCAPGQLSLASVSEHQIVFPGGGRYRILVLPEVETMTPGLLKRVASLIEQGAVVVGSPALRSPGLTGYPRCDSDVTAMGRRIWGSLSIPAKQTTRAFGNGSVIWGGKVNTDTNHLYPSYAVTSAILHSLNLQEDFISDTLIRYTHRSSEDADIYFLSNSSNRPVSSPATFRTIKGSPERWNPVTGKTFPLTHFTRTAVQTIIPVSLEPYESCFIVFSKKNKWKVDPEIKAVVPPTNLAIAGSWTVNFDSHFGGPASVQFDSLTDWSKNKNDSIRYYSGIAVYHNRFDLPDQIAAGGTAGILLNLGKIANLAHVFLNGKDLAVLWTAPWTVDISGAVKQKNNDLRIEVANLWINRLIGDEKKPDDGIKEGMWPEWMIKKQPRTSGRVSFSTTKQYNADSPLVESGLIGPVTISFAQEMK